MAILGTIILVIAFLLVMNGIYPPFLAVLPIVGAILIGIGNNKDKDKKLYDIIHNIDFVGKDITDIESIIGNHTSVNISTDDKRIYIWEDYLELLCNKDNVCVEVLKNVYSKK